MVQKKEYKTNCWEFLKCGREPGGYNTQSLGICPATIYTPSEEFLDGKNGGRACMYITGTFCGNEVQGTYMDKQDKCLKCPFYEQLQKEHGKKAEVEYYNKHIEDYFERVSDDVAITCAKVDSLLLEMAERYFPFSKISKRRFQQMVDLFRIIEMQESEVIQVKRPESDQLLYVVKGNIDIIQNTSIRSFSTFDLKGKPLLVTKDMGRVGLVCTEPAIVIMVEKFMVEQIVSWDSAFKVTRHEIESGAIGRSLLLRKLSKEAIEDIKEKLTKVEAKKGEVILDIGQKNEQYYIIESGKAEAFISNPNTMQLEKISELNKGDSFGAHSVVSGSLTNRRITITEDASLLVLDKEDFIEMIKEPLVPVVDAETAYDMVEQGYKMIDVRFREGYKSEHIHGAINIPIQELSERMSELDSNENYIVYSNSGNRSVTACVMLMRNNFQVSTLEGGFREWKFQKSGSSVGQKSAIIFGAELQKAASRKRDEMILQDRDS